MFYYVTLLFNFLKHAKETRVRRGDAKSIKIIGLFFWFSEDISNHPLRVYTVNNFSFCELVII